MLSGLLSIAQAAVDRPIEISAIEKAITINDVKLLGVLMDDWVTITASNKATIYNKFQAQNVVKNLIPLDAQNKFVMQKIGKGSHGNSYFAIGTIEANNRSYLLYFYLVYNEARKQFLLKEIRVD